MKKIKFVSEAEVKKEEDKIKADPNVGTGYLRTYGPELPFDLKRQRLIQKNKTPSPMDDLQKQQKAENDRNFIASLKPQRTTSNEKFPKVESDPSLSVVPKGSHLPRANTGVFVPPVLATEKPIEDQNPGLRGEDYQNQLLPGAPEPMGMRSIGAVEGESVLISLKDWMTQEQPLTPEEVIEIGKKYSNVNLEELLQNTKQQTISSKNREELDKVFAIAGFEDYANVEGQFFQGEWKKFQKLYKSIKSYKEEGGVENPRHAEIATQYDELKNTRSTLNKVVSALLPLYRELIQQPKFSQIIQPKKDVRNNELLDEVEEKASTILGGRSLNDVGIVKRIWGSSEPIDKMNLATKEVHGLVWKEILKVKNGMNRVDILNPIIEALQILMNPKSVGLKTSLASFSGQNIKESDIWKGTVAPKLDQEMKLRIRKIPWLFEFLISNFGSDLSKISQFFAGDMEEIVNILKNSSWVKEMISKFAFEPTVKLIKDEIINSQEISDELSRSAVKYKLVTSDIDVKDPQAVRVSPEISEEERITNAFNEMKDLITYDIGPEVLELQKIRELSKSDPVVAKYYEERENDLLESIRPLLQQVFEASTNGLGNLEKTDLMNEMGFSALDTLRTWNGQGNFSDVLSTKLKQTVSSTLRKYNLRGSNAKRILKTNDEIKSAIDVLTQIADLVPVQRLISVEMYPEKKQKIDDESVEIGTSNLAQQRIKQELANSDNFRFRPVMKKQIEPVLAGSGFLKNPKIIAKYTLDLFNALEISSDSESVFNVLSKLLTVVGVGDENNSNPLTKNLSGQGSIPETIISFLMSGAREHKLEMFPKFSKRLKTPMKDTLRLQGPTRGAIEPESGPDKFLRKKIEEFVWALFDGDLPFAKRSLSQTSFDFETLIPELAAAIIQELKPSIEQAIATSDNSGSNISAKNQTKIQELTDKIDKLTIKLMKLRKKKDEGLVGAEEKYNAVKKKLDNAAKETADLSTSLSNSLNTRTISNLSKILASNFTQLPTDMESKIGIKLDNSSAPKFYNELMETLIATFMGAASTVRPVVKVPNANKLGYSAIESDLSGLTDVENEEIQAIRSQAIGGSETNDKPLDKQEIREMLDLYPNAKRYFFRTANKVLQNRSETSDDIKQIARMVVIDTILTYARDIKEGKNHFDNPIYSLTSRIDRELKRAFKSHIQHLKVGNTSFSRSVISKLWEKIKLDLHNVGFSISNSETGNQVFDRLQNDPNAQSVFDESLKGQILILLKSRVKFVKDETEEALERQRIKNKITKKQIELSNLNQNDSKFKNKEKSIKAFIKEYEKEEKNLVFVYPYQMNIWLEAELNAIKAELPRWIDSEYAMSSIVSKTKSDTNLDQNEDNSNLYTIAEDSALICIDALQEYLVKNTFNSISTSVFSMRKKLNKLRNELSKLQKDRKVSVSDNENVKSEKNVDVEIRNLQTALRDARFQYQNAIRNASKNGIELDNASKQRYQTKINQLMQNLSELEERSGLASVKTVQVVSPEEIALKKQINSLITQLSIATEKEEKDIEFLATNRILETMKKALSETLNGKILSIKSIHSLFSGLIKTYNIREERYLEILSMKFFEFYYILVKMLGTAIQSLIDDNDMKKIQRKVAELQARGQLRIQVDPTIFAKDLIVSTPSEIAKRYELWLGKEELNDIIEHLEDGRSMQATADQAKRKLKQAEEQLKKTTKKSEIAALQQKISDLKNLIGTNQRKNRTIENEDSETQSAFDSNSEVVASSGNRETTAKDNAIDNSIFKTMGFGSPLSFVKSKIAEKLESEKSGKWWVVQKGKQKEAPKTIDDVLGSDDEKLKDLEDKTYNQEVLDDTVLTLKKLPNIVKMLNKLIRQNLKERDNELYITHCQTLAAAVLNNVIIQDSENYNDIKALCDFIIENPLLDRTEKIAEQMKQELKKIVLELGKAKIVKIKGKPAVKNQMPQPKPKTTEDRSEMFKKKPAKPGKIKESLILEPENTNQHPFQRIIDMIESGKVPMGSLKVSSVYLKKFKPEKMRQLQSLKNSCRDATGRENKNGMYKFGKYNIYLNDAFDQYIIEQLDGDLQGESINFFVPKSTLHIQ